MRLNPLGQQNLSSINGLRQMRDSSNSKVKKAADFESDMFDSALTRLKNAYDEKDRNTMRQTIDILLDFAGDEDK